MRGPWISCICLLAAIARADGGFTCTPPAVVARRPAIKGHFLDVPRGYFILWDGGFVSLSSCANNCEWITKNCLAINYYYSTGQCYLLQATNASSMSGVSTYWTKKANVQYNELFCLVNSCPVGRWGADCSKECHCVLGACNQDDGLCDWGNCNVVYLGISCNETTCANSGQWGDNCQYNCHCNNFERCRQSDGYCYNGCGTSSWIGSACNYRSCDHDNGYCAHECHQDGTLRSWCTCEAGYALDQDGRNCTLDTDECATMGAHNCSASKHEVCVNTPGSYTCHCQSGYARPQGATQCQDVDECSQGSDNCTVQNEICSNTQGAFRCDCTRGYHRESHTSTCVVTTTMPTPSGEPDKTHTPLANANDTMSGAASNGDTLPVAVIGAIAGGVVGGIVLIVFIIILVIFITRRRRQEKPVHRESGIQNNAYTVPDNPDVIPPRQDPVLPVASRTPETEDKQQRQKRGTTYPPEVQVLRAPAVMRQDSKDRKIPAVLVIEDSSDDGLVDESVPSNKSATAGPVTVAGLGSHIKFLHTGDGYNREYKSIDESIRYPCTVGSQKSNKERNKFKNIHPYDKNRVKLDDVKNDYINASYLQPLNGSVVIASQGPQKPTVGDFWAMVWQTDTATIVMLTNAMELAKVKCVQYWPSERGDPQKYGDIAVKLIEEEAFSEYICRKLKVTKGDADRRVMQYHFKAWPDHSVPLFPTGMLRMAGLVRANLRPNTAMVIHCSAGVGRTGTYLAVEELLHLAEKEGLVDVPACINRLREQRAKMVQSVLQYSFIYEAVHEGIVVGNTEFSCSDISRGVALPDDVIRKAHAHFEFLESSRVSLTDTELCVARACPSKNRSQQILAGINHRLHLKDKSYDDNYINAIKVEGHTGHGYKVTQVPLPDTTEDFWSLVWDQQVALMVLLETQDSIKELLPGFLCQSESAPVRSGLYGHKRSAHRASRTAHHHTLTLQRYTRRHDTPAQEHIYANTEQDAVEQCEERCVEVMQPLAVMSPDFIIASLESLSDSPGVKPPLIVCRDGAYQCGVYVAAVNLCSMIRHQRTTDVFYTVRGVRQGRPQFVLNREQYVTLHDVARKYIQEFDTYANFK